MGRSSHQIGVCPDGNWRHWVLGDTDMHKDGIGPIHIFFEGAVGQGLAPAGVAGA